MIQAILKFVVLSVTVLLLTHCGSKESMAVSGVSAIISTPDNSTPPPSSGVTAPSSETSAPSSETSAPSSETSAPSSETSAPSSETSAPSSETSAPSSETSAPSSETSAPSSETSAPSSETVGHSASCRHSEEHSVQEAPVVLCVYHFPVGRDGHRDGHPPTLITPENAKAAHLRNHPEDVEAPCSPRHRFR